MSDTLPERPTFISGQYIGADDLNAAVDYARDETRRLALSGRTWGIATGLALVEVPDATGSVQMFIEPGIAWDGYGRPVVVLSPAPVTPDLFASLPSGNQMVWLRYTAAGTQAVAPGSRPAAPETRPPALPRSYAIETGRRRCSSRRTASSSAAPRSPIRATCSIAVDTNASVVLDGSVAYQTFPDDTGIWLIPVGIAAYTAGAPGSFSARSADTARAQPRRCGVTWALRPKACSPPTACCACATGRPTIRPAETDTPARPGGRHPVDRHRRRSEQCHPPDRQRAGLGRRQHARHRQRANVRHAARTARSEREERRPGCRARVPAVAPHPPAIRSAARTCRSASAAA